MIILRQKEFGNKENKAAKRAYESQFGEERISDFRRANRGANPYSTDIDSHISRKGEVFDEANRDLKYLNKSEREEYARNINRYRAGIYFREKGEQEKSNRVGSRSFEKALDLERKNYKRERIDSAKKQAKDFVKNNKKGLAIGGAALGTAALVGGGIALHKARKKKAEKEEQEKKNNKKKNK